MAGTWSSKASLSSARALFIGAYFKNTACHYTMGGTPCAYGSSDATIGANANRLNTIDKYDPSTNTWTVDNSNPFGDGYGKAIHSGGVSADGTYWFITDGVWASPPSGAYGGNGYDYRADRFSYVSGHIQSDGGNYSLGQGAYEAYGSVLSLGANGSFIMVGSDTSLSGNNTEVLTWDINQGSYTIQASTPTAMMKGSIQAINGIAYVVGGQASPSGSLFTTTYGWNSSNNTWSTYASIPTPRNMPATAIFNNMVYTVGGYASSGVTGVTEYYNPTTNTWTNASLPMPTPVHGAAYSQTPNGLLVSGGYGSSGAAVTNVQYLSMSVPNDLGTGASISHSYKSSNLYVSTPVNSSAVSRSTIPAEMLSKNSQLIANLVDHSISSPMVGIKRPVSASIISKGIIPSVLEADKIPLESVNNKSISKTNSILTDPKNLGAITVSRSIVQISLSRKYPIQSSILDHTLSSSALVKTMPMPNGFSESKSTVQDVVDLFISTSLSSSIKSTSLTTSDLERKGFPALSSNVVSRSISSLNAKVSHSLKTNLVTRSYVSIPVMGRSYRIELNNAVSKTSINTPMLSRKYNITANSLSKGRMSATELLHVDVMVSHIVSRFITQPSLSMPHTGLVGNSYSHLITTTDLWSYRVPNLGSVNVMGEPVQISMFLAKPDRTIISKIKYVVNVQYHLKLGNINEITFDVPFEIVSNGVSQRNQMVDLVKERYVIQSTYNNLTEWFLIETVTKKDSGNESFLSVDAFSLGYELADKLITFDGVGVSLQTAMNGGSAVDSNGNNVTVQGALQNTLWSIGYVDSQFNLTTRTFNESQVTSLDFVFTVAQSFNAIIEWDTVNRQINFYQPQNVGTDKGLRLSYRKYLTDYEHASKTEQMVTRLHVYGNNGLSINSVNPTGADYIEDYSFFMNGYTEDANGNALTHSPYMSDSLCHAIIAYNNKVNANKSQFSTLLNQLQTQQTTLTNDQNTLNNLQTQLTNSHNVMDAKRSLSDSEYANFSITNNASVTTTINGNYYYAVMVKSNNTCTVAVDGTSTAVTANTWAIAKKIPNNSPTSSVTTVSGAPTGTTTNVIYVSIASTEYTSDTDTQILQTYCEDYNQTLVNNQQTTVNNDQTAINNTQSQITTLQNTISITSNFTADQIKEWNMFIIEKTWSDSNYTDAQTLYNDAVSRFADMHSPELQFTISLVNFLEVVQAQREWNLLNLGDIVTIDYPSFGDNLIKAKLTEIQFDIENGSISLTIANVLDPKDSQQKFIDAIDQAVGTSTSVNMNFFKWTNAYRTANAVNDTINNTWDATKRDIQAGVSESVSISNRGIIIKDPNNTNNYLVAQHGILAITNDGGNTWKHAIRPDGIVGERIFGKIIAGVNLTIETDSGIFTVDNNGVTIAGTSLTITNGLPKSQLDQQAVQYWDGKQNAITQSTTAPTSPNDGDLWLDTSQTPNILKKWNATSSTWTQVGKSIPTQNTAPTSPNTNDLWVDTSATPNVLKRWDGSQWVNASPTKPSDIGAQPQIPQVGTSPTTGLYDGYLWLDTSTTPAVMKRYNMSTSTWSVIGASDSNAVQLGVTYDQVKIDSTNGLTVQGMNASNQPVTQIQMNGATGISVSQNTTPASTPTWNSVFWTDTSGNLYSKSMTAQGLKITSTDGSSILIDGNAKKIDFSQFLTVAGQIQAVNINLKGLTVTNTNNVTTFAIDTNGNVTMSGAMTINGGTIDSTTTINGQSASTLTSNASNGNSAYSSVSNWWYANNTTYINGARIYTGTLSASQITTGTLDANSVSVVNLNASNIKAGSLQGISITGGQGNFGNYGGYNAGLYAWYNNSTAIMAADSAGFRTLNNTSGITFYAYSSGAIDMYGSTLLMQPQTLEMYPSGQIRMQPSSTIYMLPANATYGIFVDTQGGTPGTTIRPDGGQQGYCGISSYSWWAAYSKSWNVVSSAKTKTNIVDTDTQRDYELLKSLAVKKYKYKSDIEFVGDRAKVSTGIIAEQSPSEILDYDGVAIDLYALLGITVSAIQHLQRKVEDLEEHIRLLNKGNGDVHTKQIISGKLGTDNVELKAITKCFSHDDSRIGLELSFVSNTPNGGSIMDNKELAHLASKNKPRIHNELTIN